MKNDVGLALFAGTLLLIPILLFIFILSVPLVYSVSAYFLFSALTGTILNFASLDDIRDLGEDPIPLYSVLWNAVTWPLFWTLVLSDVLREN